MRTDISLFLPLCLLLLSAGGWCPRSQHCILLYPLTIGAFIVDPHGLPQPRRGPCSSGQRHALHEPPPGPIFHPPCSCAFLHHVQTPTGSSSIHFCSCNTLVNSPHHRLRIPSVPCSNSLRRVQRSHTYRSLKTWPVELSACQPPSCCLASSQVCSQRSAAQFRPISL